MENKNWEYEIMIMWDNYGKKGATSQDFINFIKQLLLSKVELIEGIEEWEESYCKEDDNLLAEIKKDVLKILGQ